jgi:hypothetical protein
MTYLVLFGVVVLAAVAFAVLSWWGGAIVLVGGILLAFYLAAARKENPEVGTVETGVKHDPGRTTSAQRGGAETANERVGQE